MGDLRNELKRVQDKLAVVSPNKTVTGAPVANSDLANARVELAALQLNPNKIQAYERILALRADIQSTEAAIEKASILKKNGDLARLHRELRESATRQITSRKIAELESKRLLEVEDARRDERDREQKNWHQTVLRQRATNLVTLGQVALCEECKQGKSIGTCDVCMGTGHVSPRQVTHYRPVGCNNNSPNCLRCGGTGIFSQTYTKLEDVCERCVGKGVIPTICNRCAGYGIVKLDRSPIDRELVPFLISALHESLNQQNRTVVTLKARLHSAPKAPATNETRERDSTKTRWFSALEKPVRKGHYETTILGSSYVSMCFWDGLKWTNKLPVGPTPAKDSWWRWRGLVRSAAGAPAKKRGSIQ
jgi:hypothetical protein